MVSVRLVVLDDRKVYVRVRIPVLETSISNLLKHITAQIACYIIISP